jgi:hypothetical protein
MHEDLWPGRLREVTRKKLVMVAGGFAEFRSVAWRYHESQSDTWLSASTCLHIRLKAILRGLMNAQSRFEFP